MQLVWRYLALRPSFGFLLFLLLSFEDLHLVAKVQGMPWLLIQEVVRPALRRALIDLAESDRSYAQSIGVPDELSLWKGHHMLLKVVSQRTMQLRLLAQLVCNPLPGELLALPSVRLPSCLQKDHP